MQLDVLKEGTIKVKFSPAYPFNANFGRRQQTISIENTRNLVKKIIKDQISRFQFVGAARELLCSVKII